MIRALLDHPWPLDALLDGSSPGFGVLRHFDRLAKRYGLKPVPFFSVSDWEIFWTSNHRYRGSALADLRRFASPLVRYSEPHCLATPSPAPADLSRGWRAALRDVVETRDWRTPQIIVADTRKPDWPAGDEVAIRVEACDDEPAAEAGSRIVAMLGSYGQHPFAASDLDPWDLQRLHPPLQSATPRLQHPCCLPKPPLAHAPLADLEAALLQARRGPWGGGGKYYFIPGQDWRYENATKEAWRKGRSFPYRKCQANDRSGFVDFEDRVWVWDETERHWDVQTKDSYIRVSHTGESL